MTAASRWTSGSMLIARFARSSTSSRVNGPRMAQTLGYLRALLRAANRVPDHSGAALMLLV